MYNVIPSISAITGVSPQRYLWRVSIALHIGPRFIIAFVYKNYYRVLINELNDPLVSEFYVLLYLKYLNHDIDIPILNDFSFPEYKESKPLAKYSLLVKSNGDQCPMLCYLHFQQRKLS